MNLKKEKEKQLESSKKGLGVVTLREECLE